MVDATFHKTIAKPQIFLWRMIFFLIIAAILGSMLHGQVWSAFMANPGLNGLILGVLFLGIVYTFRQVLRLYPEINWVNRFRISDPGLALKRPPVLLGPMATMLRDRTGRVSLSTIAMRSILESIASRLEEARDTTRYLVGLLIFLGLLGTFWGLLVTINSVGDTISSLGVGGEDAQNVFSALKKGLETPLKGMGTAFSSSLFGLAGSLILGFLDLQASQAQNRFYNELEDWLSSITELTPAGTDQENPTAQIRLALVEMQRSFAELAQRLEQTAGRDPSGTLALQDLAHKLEGLVKQMRAEQKVVREWVDEQAAQQSEMAAALHALVMRLGQATKGPRGGSQGAE